MATTKRKGSFVRVGAELRDELIEDIDSIAWEGLADVQRAARVKAALQIATPHRKGYLVDTDGWAWDDVDFLKETISSVEENLGHTAMSRGLSIGSTPIGRQIRALREKL